MILPTHKAVGACVLALAVLIVGDLVWAADPQPPVPVIQYHDDDTLTVDVNAVQLSDILAAIATQSHAEIRGELREPRVVTARFERVPLPDALDRLFGNQNYALIYGPDGSLRAIPLLNGSLLVSSGLSGRPTAAGAASTVEVSAGLTALLTQQIPVTGPVAEALGSDTASLGQLASLWLKEENPAVGAQSLQSGFRAVESMPDMRAATLSVANNYSDADLARLFRNFAGSRAEELLDIIASQTRVSEFRSKATMVLNRLRSGS